MADSCPQQYTIFAVLPQEKSVEQGAKRCGQQKTACIAGGFPLHMVAQASLLSFRVILLFLLAALLRWSSPWPTAWSTALTATL